MSKLYVVSDLTRELGVTPQTVAYDIRQGRIRAERAGPIFAFTQAQYDRALEFYRERMRSRGEEERP